MEFISEYWFELLLTFPVWSAPVMLVWYAIGIQVERGGVWKVLTPFTFAGFLFDVVLQYTSAQLWFWEIAPKGEFTISMRIGRLMESKTWGGEVARWMAPILNRLAPGGKHI